MDKQMEAFFESVTTIKVQLPPRFAPFALTSHSRPFFHFAGLAVALQLHQKQT